MLSWIQGERYDSNRIYSSNVELIELSNENYPQLQVIGLYN